MALSKLKTASQVSKELMIEAAIRETKNGMSKTAAAKMFGVCRTTMTSRLDNPTPKPVGAPRKFPRYEEDRIADFLLACSEQGIPLNRYHCAQLFSHVAGELGECEQFVHSFVRSTVLVQKFV